MIIRKLKFLSHGLSGNQPIIRDERVMRRNLTLMREDIGIRNYMRLGGDTSKLGIEGMAFGMDETGKISK